MSKFYTYVERHGKRIFHRYVENGKRRSQVTGDFPIELFIKSEKKDSVSLFGDPLARVEFEDINSAVSFVREYEGAVDVFGQTDMSLQFITHTYPEEVQYDPTMVCVAFIDIEADSSDGFPDVKTANREINAITIYDSLTKEYVSFGLKNYKSKHTESVYYNCEEEDELLYRFIAHWETIAPDILTGWNILQFDTPYLVNRITRRLGEEAANRLSYFHRKVKNPIREVNLPTGDTTYQILGLTSWDYLELYKKYSVSTQEKYSLDWIAHVELGEAKIDYSEEGSLADLYRDNFEKFLDYNIHDVRLIVRLDAKLNFIALALNVTYMAKMRHTEVFSPVRFWDAYIFNALLEKNVQIPPKKFQRLDDQIKGAFVKEPIPGRYQWVVSFDLTSLYPSIIMSFNMSPETKVRTAQGDQVNALISDQSSLKIPQGCTMTANGAMFSTKNKGIMPELVEKMFAGRKEYKNHMLTTKQELEGIKKALDKRGVKYGD